MVVVIVPPTRGNLSGFRQVSPRFAADDGPDQPEQKPKRTAWQSVVVNTPQDPPGKLVRLLDHIVEDIGAGRVVMGQKTPVMMMANHWDGSIHPCHLIMNGKPYTLSGTPSHGKNMFSNYRLTREDKAVEIEYRPGLLPMTSQVAYSDLNNKIDYASRKWQVTQKADALGKALYQMVYSHDQQVQELEELALHPKTETLQPDDPRSDKQVLYKGPLGGFSVLKSAKKILRERFTNMGAARLHTLLDTLTTQFAQGDIKTVYDRHVPVLRSVDNGATFLSFPVKIGPTRYYLGGALTFGGRMKSFVLEREGGTVKVKFESAKLWPGTLEFHDTGENLHLKMSNRALSRKAQRLMRQFELLLYHHETQRLKADMNGDLDLSDAKPLRF